MMYFIENCIFKLDKKFLFYVDNWINYKVIIKFLFERNLFLFFDWDLVLLEIFLCFYIYLNRLGVGGVLLCKRV